MEVDRLTPLDSFVDSRAPICYGILKPGIHQPGGVPVIKVKNIVGGRILEDELLKTTEKIHRKYKRSEVKGGDLLLTIRGSAGRLAMVPRSLSGANITQDTARIRVSSDDDPLYVFYALQSPRVVRQIDLNTVGQAVKGINIAEVRKIKLYHPELKQQNKIAKILSTWDEAIATTEQLLANSEQQKKALMQQLLTGKKRLPGFEGEWQKVRLRDLLTEEKARNRDKSVTRVLSVSNKHGFVLPEEYFSKQVASDDITNYRIVRKGQYGYNPSRINVGSFARLDSFDEGVLSPMYVVFSIDENKLNSDFFLAWMKSDEASQRVSSSTQGSVRDSVGFDTLCGFPFSLPPVSEQNAIAAIISVCDEQIAGYHKILRALREEKKALMQKLLTGSIRVKVNSEESPSNLCRGGV